MARLPARRWRRKKARWMCRQTARILPPRAPACAPCEPRGSVWRDPAVASAARCRNPTPDALPCPTNPPSCAERPACLWAQPRRLRPSAAALRPRRCPQCSVARGWLSGRAAECRRTDTRKRRYGEAIPALAYSAALAYRNFVPALQSAGIKCIPALRTLYRLFEDYSSYRV